MEYLQYSSGKHVKVARIVGEVLNLVINGIPSISKSFKEKVKDTTSVLNLVINGIPSI